MTTEVTVIRHGETEWNAVGRIQGHQDSFLNARGQLQTKAVADRLDGSLVDAFYSSDLTRTLQTAEPIATAMGVSVISDSRLREWKLGVLESLVLDEAANSQPEAFRIYQERDPEAVVPGGESIRQRFDRATSCLKEIISQHQDGKVVVVTHGGIIDDLYRYAKGIDLRADRNWPLYNCGINRLKIDNWKWTVEIWGDIGHLGEIGSMADWEKN